MAELLTSPTPDDDRRPRRITATQLRSMWRTASRERGWRYPDDWWTPAIDAVTEAVVNEEDIAERCSRLGRARARSGVSMRETLDDVLAFAGLVRSLWAHPAHQAIDEVWGLDAIELVRATAIGWSEEPTMLGTVETTDTATELPDCSYLAVRLGEVAAEVEGQGARLGDEFAFVVASLLGPTVADDGSLGVNERIAAWDHTWRMTQLADDLRVVFSSGETIVQAGPTTAIVLSRRSPSLPGRISALRGLLEGRRFQDADSQSVTVGIWVEGLPDNLRQARELLGDLRR